MTKDPTFQRKERQNRPQLPIYLDEIPQPNFSPYLRHLVTPKKNMSFIFEKSLTMNTTNRAMHPSRL
jgi:hypothetical protein